jgi:hypothetical protein
MGRNESVEVLLREQRKKCHKSCTAKNAILGKMDEMKKREVALFFFFEV